MSKIISRKLSIDCAIARKITMKMTRDMIFQILNIWKPRNFMGHPKYIKCFSARRRCLWNSFDHRRLQGQCLLSQRFGIRHFSRSDGFLWANAPWARDQPNQPGHWRYRRKCESSLFFYFATKQIFRTHIFQTNFDIEYIFRSLSQFRTPCW